MNKIGIKEVVDMCLASPDGVTPKLAMEMMSYPGLDTLWQLQIAGDDLIINHKIKNKTRSVSIKLKDGNFKNKEILEAVAKLYNIQKDEPDFLGKVKNIDFNQPILRIV